MFASNPNEFRFIWKYLDINSRKYSQWAAETERDPGYLLPYMPTMSCRTRTCSDSSENLTSAPENIHSVLPKPKKLRSIREGLAIYTRTYSQWAAEPNVFRSILDIPHIPIVSCRTQASSDPTKNVLRSAPENSHSELPNSNVFRSILERLDICLRTNLSQGRLYPNDYTTSFRSISEHLDINVPATYIINPDFNSVKNPKVDVNPNINIVIPDSESDDHKLMTPIIYKSSISRIPASLRKQTSEFLISSINREQIENTTS